MIDAAVEVVNDENATQEMVDVQTAAVKDAEAKLVAIKVPVNKSGLETLVYQDVYKRQDHRSIQTVMVSGN